MVVSWWVLVIIGFIFFSGYMSFRAMRAEMKLEQEYIEKEGQVYMERIKHARTSKGSEEETENVNEMKSVG